MHQKTAKSVKISFKVQAHPNAGQNSQKKLEVGVAMLREERCLSSQAYQTLLL